MLIFYWFHNTCINSVKKKNKYNQVCKASGTNQWWPCNSHAECQGWAETVESWYPRTALNKPSWQLVSEPTDLWGCFYYESHCSCLTIFTLTYYFEVELLLCWDLAKVTINLNLSWWMLTCKLTIFFQKQRGLNIRAWNFKNMNSIYESFCSFFILTLDSSNWVHSKICFIATVKWFIFSGF